MPKIKSIHQFFIQILLTDIADLRILQSDWMKVFLAMSNLKFTNHLLSFLNLYLQTKNQVDSSIFSCRADLRILQSDWLRAFWFITQEQKFSQTWDLFRLKTNNVNFCVKPNPKKRLFWKNLKNTYFWPFWAHFTRLGKNNFLKKLGSVSF